MIKLSVSRSLFLIYAFQCVLAVPFDTSLNTSNEVNENEPAAKKAEEKSSALLVDLKEDGRHFIDTSTSLMESKLQNKNDLYPIIKPRGLPLPYQGHHYYQASPLAPVVSSVSVPAPAVPVSQNTASKPVIWYSSQVELQPAQATSQQNIPSVPAYKPISISSSYNSIPAYGSYGSPYSGSYGYLRPLYESSDVSFDEYKYQAASETEKMLSKNEMNFYVNVRSVPLALETGFKYLPLDMHTLPRSYEEDNFHEKAANVIRNNPDLNEKVAHEKKI